MIQRSKEWWLRLVRREPDVPITAGAPESYVVEGYVYEAAVKGRQEFRASYRAQLIECERLRAVNSGLLTILRDLDCSDILGVAESCASGMPRWEFVRDRIERARNVLTALSPTPAMIRGEEV